MKRNSSVILAGVVAVAAAAGMTYAIVQPNPTGSNSGSTSRPSPPVATPQPTAPSSPMTQVPASPAPTEPVAPVESPVTEPPGADRAPVAPGPEPDRAVSRQVEFCSVSMAVVKDPEPPLNVRSAPSTAGSILGKLKNGEWVSVQDEKDGWLQITNPIAGWISKQRTDHACNRKIERIRFSGDRGRLTISDRFVGGGNHSYVFSLQQGQRLTITRANGPFPYVTLPGGRGYLLDQRQEPTQTWTGEIPKPGEYAIELDSNFKGYQYSFLVEVQ